jgi:hypothetical protein
LRLCSILSEIDEVPFETSPSGIMPICSASVLVTILAVDALRCLSKRVTSVNGYFRDVPSELIENLSHLMLRLPGNLSTARALIDCAELSKSVKSAATELQPCQKVAH